MANQWSYDDPPWQDEDKVRGAYASDRPLSEVAEEWGCARSTIDTWIDKFGIERQQTYDGKWRDKDALKELYWGERLSTHEIAERLDCSQSTIWRWLNRHGIPIRHSEHEHGSIRTTRRGYTYYTGGSGIVYIHQLTAIADGEDPEDVFSDREHNTHHKNGIPWHNTMGNVETITAAKHNEKHREELIQSRWG